MTRFRIPLLSAALLFAAVAGAQGFPVSNQVNMGFFKHVTYTPADGSAQAFVSDYSVAYGALRTDLAPNVYTFQNPYPEGQTEEEVAALGPSDPQLRLIPGENFRLLLVVSDRALPAAEDEYGNTASDYPAIPVAIDAAGNWVALETNGGADIECEWLTCTWKDGSGDDFITVGEVHGVPNVEQEPYDVTGTVDFNGAEYTITARAHELSGFFTRTGLTTSSYAYVFLVVLDTRMPDATGTDWVCAGAPVRVARYGIAYVGKPSAFPLECDFAIARAGHGVLLGNPSPVRPAVGVTSLTVDGKVLIGAELDAYLTPTFAAAPLERTGESLSSGMTLYPYCEAGLLTYTLQTKASLADSEWQNAADWLRALREAGGTVADDATLQDYSRVPADGRTPLVLPRVDGEKSRFYRLVAPGK